MGRKNETGVACPANLHLHSANKAIQAFCPPHKCISQAHRELITANFRLSSQQSALDLLLTLLGGVSLS